jgi:endoglucanase
LAEPKGRASGRAASGRSASGRWLKIAEGILRCPTATFLEDVPAEHVRQFARRRSSLSLSEDRWGNLVVSYPAARAPKAPPLVLVAHLDHPGFAVTSVRGDEVELEFRGGVRRKHAVRGTKLDFYRRGQKRAIGQGTLLSTSEEGARRPGMLGRGRARIDRGRAVEGGFTMWAFPAFEVRGGKMRSRCLDDLAGAAAALAVLDEMHRRRPRGAHVVGLFTRAEETGFLGALGAIRSRTVRRDARVLSLETSRALPSAPIGGGVIVRVGDAMSLFHPPLMGRIAAEAKRMAAEDEAFRWQRRLMDGGSCEATAFCAAGYRSGGVCLPLGNYHNMSGLDGGRPGIGPEFIAVDDYVSEVKLLVRLAEGSASLAQDEDSAREWLRGALPQAVKALRENPLADRG